MWTSYLALGGSGLVALIGASAMIEMMYHLQLNAALGPTMSFLGATLNTQGVDSWLGAIFVLGIGIAMFELSRRSFSKQWGRIQEEIEAETKKREGGAMSAAASTRASAGPLPSRPASPSGDRWTYSSDEGQT